LSAIFSQNRFFWSQTGDKQRGGREGVDLILPVSSNILWERRPPGEKILLTKNDDLWRFSYGVGKGIPLIAARRGASQRGGVKNGKKGNSLHQEITSKAKGTERGNIITLMEYLRHLLITHVGNRQILENKKKRGGGKKEDNVS